MSLANVFDIAGMGMSAQSVRLNTTASNLANAETSNGNPETVYRARHPVFAAVQQRYMNQSLLGDGDTPAPNVGVQVLGIVESDAPVQQRYQPDHPEADEEGYVYYSNVNAVEEMANMISASRSFQINVEVMNAAKTMMQRVLTLGQ